MDPILWPYFLTLSPLPEGQPHGFIHHFYKMTLLYIHLQSKPLNSTPDSYTKMSTDYLTEIDYKVNHIYHKSCLVSFFFPLRNGAIFTHPETQARNLRITWTLPSPLAHLSKPSSYCYNSYWLYPLSVSTSLPFPLPSPAFWPFLLSAKFLASHRLASNLFPTPFSFWLKMSGCYCHFVWNSE